MKVKMNREELLNQCEEFRNLYLHWMDHAQKMEKERDDFQAKFIDAVKYSCPEKYMKIFHDHKIQSPEDLDFKLDKLREMEDKILYLRESRKDLARFADLLHMGAELYAAR